MSTKKIRINKNSFRFKIAFYYLVASLSVIFIFSSIIYILVSHIIVRETVSKTETTIKTSSEMVGEILSHKKIILELYSTDKTLQAFVAGENQLQDDVQKQINAIAESDRNILGTFIRLENGSSLSSTESSFSNTSDPIATQSPCITSDRIDDYEHKDNLIVTLAVPLEDEKGTQIGVLGVDLDYCIFFHTFENLNIGEQDFIFIEDSAKNIVFRSDKIYGEKGNENIILSDMLENGFDSQNDTLVYSILIPNTDWTMFGVATPAGLNILKRQLFDMMIVTTMLLSIALIIISIVASRNLTDPISRLVAGMEDIQELAELSINKNEISETVILTQSYNRMIYKIKNLMQELEQKQGELRNAEFDALTSQINPHFLYNTLDTIVWLAEFKDTEKIIKLTKSLASFFRLSLNGGKSVVSLSDEIEHVKQYLFIQQERYGDKFNYSFSIDDNTLDCLIPKILLQPIVENAIYHGIKPMDTNGFINIEAEIKDDFLVITISDNGIGFQASNNFKSLKKTSNSVGLNNIEKRIKLFYSEHSKLQIQTSETGTIVTLLLNQSVTHK